MSRSHLFTSESVTEGHPDKLADQLSDAVLDAMLTADPNSRVACESLVTTGLVIVAGEITCDAWVDIPSVVRRTVTEVGYTDAKFGLDGETCGVLDRDPGSVARHRQGGRGRDRAPRGTFRGRAGSSGCRRPGHDVRFRLPRDGGADAAPDRHGAPARPSSGRRPSRRRGSVPASGRQGDGHHRVRRQRAGARGHGPDLRAAPRGSGRRDAPQARHRGRGGGADPSRAPRDRRVRHEDHREPHRTVRDRRTEGRYRAHRSQDHRRHVRRHGAARRRCLLREGPDQGRPLRRVHGAVRGEERRGRRGSPTAVSSRSRTRSGPPIPFP